jgi:hypothetical protein
MATTSTVYYRLSPKWEISYSDDFPLFPCVQAVKGVKKVRAVMFKKIPMALSATGVMQFT